MKKIRLVGFILTGISIITNLFNTIITGNVVSSSNSFSPVNFVSLISFILGISFLMASSKLERTVRGGLDKATKGKNFEIASNTAINLVAADKILELQKYLDGLDVSDATQAVATAGAGAGLYMLNQKKIIGKISKKAGEILSIPKTNLMPYIKALVLSGALAYGSIQIKPDLEKMVEDVKGKKEITVNHGDEDLEIDVEYPIIHRSSTTAGKFERTHRWDNILDEIEDKYEIPRGLLKGLAMREGYGDPLRLNEGGDGGAGMFQFQPGTAKAYGLEIYGNSSRTGADKSHGTALKELVAEHDWDYEKLSQIDERFDVRKSANAAGRFLKELYGRFGSWDKALSAYNRGTPAKKPLETNHVKAVKKYQDYYNKKDRD